MHLKKLSAIFNALRPASVNKTPILFVAFDHGKFNVAALKLPRPLDAAIGARDYEAVEKLLKAGANPNLFTHFSGPALSEAVKTRQLNLLPLLLKHGAKIDQPNKAGATPLHEAVTQFSTFPIALKIVLALHPGLEAKNSLGFTPLEWARQLQQPKAAEMIEAYAAERAARPPRRKPAP